MVALGCPALASCSLAHARRRPCLHALAAYLDVNVHDKSPLKMSGLLDGLDGAPHSLVALVHAVEALGGDGARSAA